MSFSRRKFLVECGNGAGALGLAALLAGPARGAASKIAGPHHQVRAKRVIFLFMAGGPSHVDLFDPKPKLTEYDGQPAPFRLPDLERTAPGNVQRSPFQFARHGESGIDVSELFPHVGAVADELCFIKSMYSNNNAHTPATLELHTGSQTLMRPSMGSWIAYGLGSENQNLPGFVTICPPLTYSGQRNFGSAFLPATYQGTMIGTNRIAAKEARFRNIDKGALTTAEQRQMLDLLQAGNREQLQRSGDDVAWQARMASFELAFRMQAHAPEVLDLSSESRETLALYGVDDPVTENYGRELLLARRCVERGIRFVHVAHTGGRGGR